MLRRDPLMPPRRLQRYAREEFVESGAVHLAHLRELAGLRPEHRVLELGCGTGRLARELVGFLDRHRGSYDGLDVDRAAIGWCRRAYGRRHRHARFLLADVADLRARPAGAHVPAEYRLPYEDGSFDVVVVLSAFAHALEESAARQLAECARVLAPEGRIYAGLFVLDEDSRARISGGDAALAFLDADAHVAVLSDDVPEEGVAYDRCWLDARLAESGLQVTELAAGGWRGRRDARDLLDVVVAARA